MTRTTARAQESLPLHQSTGFAAKLDIEQLLAGSTSRRTSTTSSSNNYLHNISSFSYREHQINLSPHASRRHHYVQLPAATTADTTQSTASTSTTFYYISFIYHQVVHSRTNHLQHQCQRHRVQLRKRSATRLREQQSPLQWQPAELRIPSGSTSRTSALLGNLVRHRSHYIGCASELRRSCTSSAALHATYFSTATSQPMSIYGYKDILLTCVNNSFPGRFYICDIKAPLLKLHNIFDSEAILHINAKDCTTIEHHCETEPLYVHPTIAATSSSTPWRLTSPRRPPSLGQLHPAVQLQLRQIHPRE